MSDGLARQTRPVSPLVLLIDDSPDDLRALTQLLQGQFRLAWALNGHQGQERAQALNPQLILLDIALPDMDGLALCRLLKQNPLTAETPVLFLTARIDVRARVIGLESGAVDFICKPFYAEEVLARMRVHLRLAEFQGKLAPPSGGPTADDGDDLLVDETVRYIRQNLANLPSVAAIAGRVGVHEKRLLQLFRIRFGQTVTGFISAQRLEAGARLLRETAVSVQEIALTVGFVNPGNFSTAFRAFYGLSPLSYRQSLPECSPT